MILACPAIPFFMDSETYTCAYSGLRMWSVSDNSAVDIAASPTSDAGTFLLQVPPFLYEEWTSPWTTYSPSDSLGPEFNAKAGSLASYGAIYVYLLTRIFRNQNLLVSVHQYRILLFGASTEKPGHLPLKTSSLVSTKRDFLSTIFRTRSSRSPRVPLTRQPL